MRILVTETTCFQERHLIDALLNDSRRDRAPLSPRFNLLVATLYERVEFSEGHMQPVTTCIDSRLVAPMYGHRQEGYLT